MNIITNNAAFTAGHYSDPAHLQLAQTQVNFPSCKHFFPCNEAIGSTTLTDIVGGVLLPFASATFTGNYFDPTGNMLNITPTTGAIVSVGNSGTTIMLVAASAGSGSVAALGASGSAGARLLVSTSAPTVNDGTTAKSPVLSGVVSGGGLATICSFPSDKVTARNISAAAINTPMADIALSAAVAVTAVNTSNISFYAAAVTAVYGVGVFQFAGNIPNDLNSALTWMTAQWVAGNKVLYPGWRGRT